MEKDSVKQSRAPIKVTKIKTEVPIAVSVEIKPQTSSPIIIDHNIKNIFKLTKIWGLIITFYGNFERCKYLMQRLSLQSAKQWLKDINTINQNFFNIIDCLHSSRVSSGPASLENLESNRLMTKGSIPMYFSKDVKDMMLTTIKSKQFSEKSLIYNNLVLNSPEHYANMAKVADQLRQRENSTIHLSNLYCLLDEKQSTSISEIVKQCIARNSAQSEMEMYIAQKDQKSKPTSECDHDVIQYVEDYNYLIEQFTSACKYDSKEFKEFNLDFIESYVFNHEIKSDTSVIKFPENILIRFE